MAQRYLEKFEGPGTATTYSYSFPLNAYEWRSDGSVVGKPQDAVGMDYGYDLRNLLPSPIRSARETVRAINKQTTVALLDQDIDDMRYKLLLAGRGKLYSIDATATRRWCWARIDSLPEFTVRSGMLLHNMVSMRFARLSDWFSTTQQTGTDNSETVTADAQTWVVNNPGDLPAKLMQIRLRANTAAGIINPIITNQTNGYVFGTARDSADADSEIRLDTENGAVEWSTNNGSSYSDDFANYTLPSNQAALTFRLDRGNNTIRYNGGGTPNLDVEFEYYPAFPS